MIFRFCCLMLVVLVAACGPVPRAFDARDASSRDSILSFQDLGIIKVETVEGPSGPLADMIAEGLVADLSRRNVIATVNPVERPAFILSSFAAEAPPGSTPGHIVTLHWALEKADGTVVGNVSQKVEGRTEQWLYGDNQFIDAITDDAATALAAFLLNERDRNTAGEQEDDGRLRVFVTGVTGAPGRGNRELADALVLALRQGGALLVDQPGEAEYLLDGSVDLGPALEGQQGIEIIWKINLPDGSTTGRARQTNRVPAGALDGVWGAVAFDIARAALDGIAGVIDRHQREDSRGAGKLLIPETYELPPLGGKAPPPPQ